MAKRIALVHDYIKEYGGAERVLETLHEMYPDAPVYTLVYCPEFLGPHKERFKNWNIKTSSLQEIPFKDKLISPFRLLAPLMFRTFDFSGFDIIIVSATGAYNPNIIDKKTAKQICYCHTPPRYLYGYATARNWKKDPLLRILGEIANHMLRLIDYYSAQHVDQFSTNSQNVAGRIKKFYKKDSVVVYPPVGISNFKFQISNKKNNSNSKSSGYYLAGGRLARAKHYDLIIKACAELGVQLKIFGKGFAGYEEELKEIRILANKDIRRKNEKEDSPSLLVSRSPNIEFLGEVSDSEKLELMSQAKAFIFAGEDEDFGIIPVEAMSVGTPVIAYKSGGVLETIVNKKTGIFFDELTVESLVKAIKEFGKLKIKPEDCINQAKKFSVERFKREIEKIVNDIK